MQNHPPRYRYMTEAERLEAEAEGWVDPPRELVVPVRRRKMPKRATELEDPVFDITHWRLPSRWRNDKNVGDVAISKMLRGVATERFEMLTTERELTV